MRFRFFLSVCLLFAGFFIGVIFVYSFIHSTRLEDEFSWRSIFLTAQKFSFFSSGSIDIPHTPSFLTGLPVAAQPQFVAAVMIDNFPDARPQQIGLSEASIVYEAIAEGGITRYMAIVPVDNLSMVGPVRSARPYFVDWASEYGGFYVHVGGSDTALNDLLSNSAVYNIDGLSWEEVTFASKEIPVPEVLRSTTDFLVNRLSTLGGKTLFQPHNLFLDLVYLGVLGDFLQSSVDRSFAPTESHFLFAEDPVLPVDAIVVDSFSIDFSFPSYLVDYVYDETTGLYNRLLAGEPAVDLLGSIQPKNVIVLLTPAVQVDDYGRLDMDTRSGGKAWVFTDGMMILGTWKYDAAFGRTRFFASDGMEIALQAGQTWIEVINRQNSLVVGQ